MFFFSILFMIRTCSAETGVLRIPFDIFLDQIAWSTIFSPFCLCSLLSAFCHVGNKKEMNPKYKNVAIVKRKIKDSIVSMVHLLNSDIHLVLLLATRHLHVWPVHFVYASVQSRVGSLVEECLLLVQCGVSLIQDGSQQ